MATKLYFESSGTPPFSPSPVGWADITNLVRKTLNKTKASSALTTQQIPSTTGAVDSVMSQYVSPPLTPGQTITGGQTISMQMRFAERNSVGNQQFSWGVYVVNHVGNTLKKTLVAKRVDGTEFVVTTQTNRTDSATGEAGDYTTVKGDFIVVEIGTNGNSSDASGWSQLRDGSASASDLPADDSTTTDDNPNLNFATNTLNFDSSVAATGTHPILSVISHIFTSAISVGTKPTHLILSVVSHIFSSKGRVNPNRWTSLKKTLKSWTNQKQ